MENVNTVALSKAIKDKVAKEARNELSAGKYDVDFDVHVKGTLSVGEDSTMSAKSSLLNQEFFALVLKYSGVTREAALVAVDKVAQEYLVNWTGSDSDKKAAKEFRKQMVAEFDPEGKIQASFDEFAQKLPKVPRKGAVSFKGEVEVVEAVASESALRVA